jgi:hypothetical protein
MFAEAFVLWTTGSDAIRYDLKRGGISGLARLEPRLTRIGRTFRTAAETSLWYE